MALGNAKCNHTVKPKGYPPEDSSVVGDTRAQVMSHQGLVITLRGRHSRPALRAGTQGT